MPTTKTDADKWREHEAEGLLARFYAAHPEAEGRPQAEQMRMLEAWHIGQSGTGQGAPQRKCEYCEQQAVVKEMYLEPTAEAGSNAQGLNYGQLCDDDARRVARENPSYTVARITHYDDAPPDTIRVADVFEWPDKI